MHVMWQKKQKEMGEKEEKHRKQILHLSIAALRILAMYEANTAKISNFWILLSITLLIRYDQIASILKSVTMAMNIQSLYLLSSPSSPFPFSSLNE